MDKKIARGNKYQPELYSGIFTSVLFIIVPLIFHTLPLSKYSIWAIFITAPFLGFPFGLMLAKIWKLLKVAAPPKL